MIRTTTTRHRSARAAAVLAAFFGAVSFVSEASAQQDMAVVAITAPTTTGCVALGSEDVSIRAFNYGVSLPAGSAFNVSYTVNAGAPVTELVVLGNPLFSHSEFGYTFSTQANLSVPGMYTFDATVSLPGDVNPTNDAYTGYVVYNATPSVGGTLTGPGAPSSSGTLTLSGSVGNIAQWEESDDGGLRWFGLVNASTSQDYADLRAPTQFRVRVLGAPCGADVLSNVVTVSP